MLMARSRMLDVWRAVATIAVLGRHMKVCPPELNREAHYLTFFWQQGGWVGVDFFFVLSGFLISGLLFREYQKYNSISFKNFFLRRGLKIYPPFVLLIVSTVLLRTLAGEYVYQEGLIRELLFVQNYLDGLWNHTWSLAVEEHFYILLPLVFMLSLRFKKTNTAPFIWIPVAFAALAVTTLMLRIDTAANWPKFDFKTHVFATHLRLDSLFCGVTISYFYHWHPERLKSLNQRFRSLFLILGTLCFVPAFLFESETTPFIYTYGFVLFWIGGGLLLMGSIYDEPKPSPLINALSFIGSRSYSIYLWHMVVIWLTDMALLKFVGDYSWFPYAAIYLAGSIFVGTVMAHAVENPVLRLRDRFYPSRSQPLSVTS